MSSEFVLHHPREARGYAVDLDDLSRRLVVEILADGLPIGLVRANLYVEQLRAEGIGDGRYGFLTSLPEAVLTGNIVLEARIANTGDVIGKPIIADLFSSRGHTEPFGEVHWVGGLRLAGSLSERNGFGAQIRAIVDGRPVAEALASQWSHHESGTTYVVRPSFDLHLPTWMADGRVRHVDIVSSDGSAIRGAPVFVVAFADGLTDFIDQQADLESEKMRARYAETLIPQSLPFSAFPDWSLRFAAPQSPRPSSHYAGVVLIGQAHLDRCVDSLAAQTGVSCIIAGLPASVSP